MRTWQAEQSSGDDGFRSLHMPLAGPLAAALTTLVRAPLGVEAAGDGQQTYERFVAALETPTCLHVVPVKPLGDCLLVAIELGILFPLLDRMLGGGGDDFAPPRRALSDIELPLAARLTRTFLQQLRQAWSGIAGLEFDLPRAERNPRLSRIFPADEPMLCVEFRLTLGNHQGLLRLAYPRRLYARLRDAAANLPDKDESRREALVEVSVAWPALSLTAEELSSLGVGDIILTDAPSEAPVVVALAGRPQFLARPGVCGGRKAVIVGDPVHAF